MGSVIDIRFERQYPVAFDALRSLLISLESSGVEVRRRLLESAPVESETLFPGWIGSPLGRSISDIGLSPSERRLHRESEQVFRVLEAGAAAIASLLIEEDVSLRLHNVGAVDLPSLRGLLRIVEHLAFHGARGLLVLTGLTSRSTLGRELAGRGRPSIEYDRFTSRLGDTDRASGAASVAEPINTPESRLFASVLDPQGGAVDRVAFAVETVRRGFFRSDYEVMTMAALVGLELASDGVRLDGTRIDEVLRREDVRSPMADAVEFELGVLRSPADVRAFFRKVLGMVHSFREEHRAALDMFSGISRDDDCSVELRAQAVLYMALTKVKMLRDPELGRRQADHGIALLNEHSGGTAEASRERGWLLNVRALCAFAQGKLSEALTDEKAALSLVSDGRDSSSVHLKINLISNISVLQERAGKLKSALSTWQKYTSVGRAWGPMFTKHHAYRRGGLALGTGDVEEAVSAYEEAFRAATELSDTFHRAAIASELGALHLTTDRDRSATWFREAERASVDLGDPYGNALARTGLAASQAGLPGDEVARQATEAITYPERGMGLADAIRSGDRDRCVRLLPMARTKLNRPFDHVNLV